MLSDLLIVVWGLIVFFHVTNDDNHVSGLSYDDEGHIVEDRDYELDDEQTTLDKYGVV